MNTPEISIIVSVYNSAKFLHGCLRSLTQQTFKDIEILIADSGSTDRTAEIAKYFTERDSRFQHILVPGPRHVSHNRAFALQQCRAPYIAILDSDDIAYPHRLQEQIDWLTQHPQDILVSSRYRVINTWGIPIRLSPTHFVDDIEIRWRLTFGNCLIHSTIMFRKDVAVQAGGYDSRIMAGEDIEFYSRLLRYGTIGMIPHVLVAYRTHGGSLSNIQPLEERKDFLSTVQNSVRLQTGFNISLETAAALYNQSQEPAQDESIFREALSLTKQTYVVFTNKWAKDAFHHKLLARSVFIQYLDLMTRNSEQKWWKDSEEIWSDDVQSLCIDANYCWYKDIGLLWYYKKLIKTDVRLLNLL